MRQDNPMVAPSLVGDSVRNVDDAHSSESRDEPIDHATSSSMVLNKIQPQSGSVDGSYTTVDELNREGALLTDEMDMDQVVNATDKVHEDPDEHRKWLKSLKKKQLEQSRDHSNNNNNKSNGSLTASPVHSSESKSLLGSVDLGDDQITFSPQSKSRSAIRNSYGEFIRDESHRPHLAKGESYQSAGGTGETLPIDEKEERLGRRTARSLDTGSREYLRSLSRSLSRDPAAHRRNQQVSTAEAGESLENARLYSTNNYSISQADLEHAPHIIQTLKEEPEESEESHNHHKHVQTPKRSNASPSSKDTISEEHATHEARHL
ncbi:hypothetical protein ZYGR_0P02180 [Zygosaccharomyces rouxii]|uniref:ZYRO0E05500p n=2 Tax=Zygosaccharomyces rouxii TaxID=4956 RepID=C5E4F3_ZYGRC|nr:uncharacterized protein ZYRO0E05500g [Zygosaccharomyces rouxii]KAH9198228.1 hypothetical protein LQ764DRAFT_155753 [Zygosaccharomyces rouxii]GAV49573.1 hypothetical protein ZYGR_0P02180 [Zygosaccharomyces rouxii]CAR30914.1 ZYRO0E05500p [Zygosaccharomyces rouxii]